MGVKELSKSKKKRRNIVSFDEEIVTKDNVVNHLAELSKIVEDKYTGKISHDGNFKHVKSFELSNRETQKNEKIDVNSSTNANTNESHSRKKNKKLKRESETNEKSNGEFSEENVLIEIPNKKRKKNKKSGELEIRPAKEENEAETQSKKQKKNKKLGELETKLEQEEYDEADKNPSIEIQNKKRKSGELEMKPEQKYEADENSSTEIRSKKQKKNKKLHELETKLEQVENEEPDQDLSVEIQKKKRKKSKKSGKLDTKSEAEEKEQVEQTSSTEIQSNKQNKNKKSSELETSPVIEENDAVVNEAFKTKKENSIRAQKRMKHEKLLKEKRLKAAAATQQNVLNYLSKWKHARNEWKFEKLKQIWLQQNLFDCNKIPNEFWDTAVDYFNGSKGFIRNCVLRDALKIIEKAESSQEEENVDGNQHLVLKRAQNIIQHLQE